MKRYCLLSIILFLTILTIAQVKGQIDSTFLPATGPHYQPEYDFDRPVDANSWSKERPGLNVAFGSEEKLYFRTEVPGLKADDSWQATGWKGERLNTQIVVWSADTLQQVRFNVSDLRDKNGKLISKANIKLNKVCYVLANYPYGSREGNCGATPFKDGYLMPDRFETFDRFEVPAKTVRPVWLSCNIPSTTEPGTYNGTIEVKSKNGRSVLNISIKVQDQTLPKPHDWTYRLDLWQNPWVIAEYYHVKPWSEEHKALLKKHLQLYADAGGTYITTYGVHSPWGDNEYSIEGGMIEWIRQRNGSWKFD